MKSRAYRAVDVNRIDCEEWLGGRGRSVVHAGLDIGKEWIFCALRWGAGNFDRPWRVGNPFDVVRLAELLAAVGHGRQLIVAMEPTGTYGDAARQALARAGVVVHRVSPKMASDYAEVFDGVPSQHDGKDAAVVAELGAQGKSWPWPLPTPSAAEQELVYQVRWLDDQRRQWMQWCGRVEALLSRHWPEATRIVPLRSGMIIACLAEYGGPRGLAGASDALARVQRWGGTFLSEEKARAFVASAASTVGVALSRWDEELLRQYARQMQGCRRAMSAARRRLKVLTRDQAAIQAMSAVVGIGTACVLWVELGDPSRYHCGAAFRKAMGLNLAERSSGQWQGTLKISKRGSSQVRRWLYLAALRWLKHEPVRSWYLRQKARRRGEGKPAVIGVMRKLALVLYRVGGRGAAFDRQQLYRAVISANPA